MSSESIKPNTADSAFTILPFSAENLCKALSNVWFSPAAVSIHGRAKYLVGYLSDLNAKSILIENEYTDGDYLDDFAQYYVKCFAPYERKCKRLHFFSSEIERTQFIDYVSARTVSAISNLQSSYLGFVVCRPLPEAIVGRTVLAHYPPKKDNGERHYTALKEYEACLFGIPLKVRSLAFQEQDTVLAACATVSLWCCFHKTADLFGTPAPTPAAITRAANVVMHESRPIPTHHLNLMQMCNAISQVGLEPEVVGVTKNTPLISLIYAHLRYGIPVMLGVEIEGVGHHAMTIAGYSIKKSSHLQSEVSAGAEAIPMTGLRVDEFYAHDDQIGPFSRLKVKPGVSAKNGSDYPVVFEGSWVDANGTPRRLLPVVVVIPVYHKIRVTFLEVQEWLTRLNTLVVDVLPGTNAIEWDVYLVRTNTLKKELQFESQQKPDELDRILFREHPRFAWCADLRINGTLNLQLLCDATDISRSFVVYDAIWHTNDFQKMMTGLLKEPKLQSILSDVLTEKFRLFLSESLK